MKPILRNGWSRLKDLGMTTRTMRNTGSTDHVSFDAVGIPLSNFSRIRWITAP